ncbi:Tubulin epsilon chain [Phlyctochytrium bullatum]|nr:Tubulin epsilon chain [Phlyctochytrium bullatum]
MDGISSVAGTAEGERDKIVMVLAATNFPWHIDEALRRRLEKRIYIPLPDLESRKELLRINLQSIKIAEDLNLEEMAEKLEGYSGADITNVRSRSVASEHVEEELEIPASKDDFMAAIAKIQSSVGQNDLKRYKEWMDEYGSSPSKSPSSQNVAAGVTGLGRPENPPTPRLSAVKKQLAGSARITQYYCKRKRAILAISGFLNEQKNEYCWTASRKRKTWNTSKKLFFFVALRDIEPNIVPQKKSAEGWILKKGNRKMQGYAKRWLKIDADGNLSYYRMPGSELMHFKAITPPEFQMWVSALQSHAEAKSANLENYEDIPLPRPPTSLSITTDFANESSLGLKQPDSSNAGDADYRAKEGLYNEPEERGVENDIDSLHRATENLVISLTRELAKLRDLTDTSRSRIDAKSQWKDFTLILGSISDVASGALSKSVSLQRNIGAYNQSVRMNREKAAITLRQTELSLRAAVADNNKVRRRFGLDTVSPEHFLHTSSSSIASTSRIAKSHLVSGSSSLRDDVFFDAEEPHYDSAPDEDDGDDNSVTSEYLDNEEGGLGIDEEYEEDLGDGVYDDDDDDGPSETVANATLSKPAPVIATEANPTETPSETEEVNQVSQENGNAVKPQESSDDTKNLEPVQDEKAKLKASELKAVSKPAAPVARRKTLPAPTVSMENISILSILRNNVGKDLSTVAMPIALNEPLNLLQKLVEELEYSELLDQAGETKDPIERLILITVTTCMRNIFSSGRYLEHYGTMKIQSEASGHYCQVTFKESGYFTSAKNEVAAVVHDANGNEVAWLTGKWDESLCRYHKDTPNKLEVIWRARPCPPNHQQMYGFTSFAVELNEITPDISDKLPNTDTRFRTDQRMYEEGKVDDAEKEKLRLEQKQREYRKKLEAEGKKWIPQWFEEVASEGTTIGGRFWDLLYHEHARHNQHNRFDEATATFFRNVDEKNGVSNIPVGNGMGKVIGMRARVWNIALPCSTAFKAVLVDMEEGVIGQIQASPFRKLFDSRQTILRAVGYTEYGQTYYEDILESVRYQSELCDSLQSFLMVNSIGGGTGSGLGSKICEMLYDEFPNVYRFNFILSPSANDDVITSPYNRFAALNEILTRGSILSLSRLIDNSDCILPLENQALMAIANKVNQKGAGTASKRTSIADSGRKRYGGLCGGASTPHPFEQMNNIAANLLVNLTCSMRFPGSLNVDMSDIVTNLVPFRRQKFVLSAMAPLFSLADMKAETLRVDQIFTEAFSRENQLVQVDAKSGVYVSV